VRAEHFLPSLDDPLSAAVMVAGLAVASLARGYSGFGFSALLVTSWALVTDPAIAVALALTLEVMASIVQAASVWRFVPWRRVGLLFAGALIGSPIGVQLLAHSPHESLKLGIAAFVLVSSLALLAGYRLTRQANAGGTAAVGVVSGIANGAAGMGGLPVALFLTAGGDEPARIRAAAIAYIFTLDLFGLLLLAREGLVERQTFVTAALSLPVLLAGLWLGARQFLGASPESFRRSVLWLLILLALIGIARAVWDMA
jgi:uncharacterized membrane protein YfcA